MSGKITGENALSDQAEAVLCDCSEVLTLADDLRAHLQLHQLMGIDRYPLTQDLREWLARKKVRPEAAEARRPSQPLPSRQAVKPQSVNEPSASGLLALHQEIEVCGRCPLVTARQGQVIGLGKMAARLFVVGDYSQQSGEFSTATLFGADEDSMLWNMMRAIGLAPEDVYVSNAIKCCPQAAASPEEECEKCCRDYLRREIELVSPHVVCAMGEAAARSVLGSREPVARLRGRFQPYPFSNEEGRNVPVMVTYHPRFLLAFAEMKKAAWQDLQMIQRQLLTRNPSGTS